MPLHLQQFTLHKKKLKKHLELLAPGGDFNSIKAAILAGTNAVYCGLNRFNARNRASNISFDELLATLRIAHSHQCKVYLTLNVLMLDHEFNDLFKLLSRLVNTSIDGIIVQDIGLLFVLKTYFPKLEVHASTQMTTHNCGQLSFLNKFNVKQVNLSRELSLPEIKQLSIAAHSKKIKTEVFVHGSYCISFSGICYMSFFQNGKSGNRGQCSQPCREEYKQTPAGKIFPLNLKDNSAFHNLADLVEAKADSLKIEGRIKEFDYVYTVVNSWRKHLDYFYKTASVGTDKTALHKVFNREFTNAYLLGNIGESMFIENPMSQSSHYFSEKQSNVLDACSSPKERLYQEKNQLRSWILERISQLKSEKITLDYFISGKAGEKLSIEVYSADTTFKVQSNVYLSNEGIEALSHAKLFEKLKSIEEFGYRINQFKLEVETNTYLPFKEIKHLKKSIFSLLNNSQEYHTPIKVPKLKHSHAEEKAELMVQTSSFEDAQEIKKRVHTLIFELPSALCDFEEELNVFFRGNPDIVPCFPSMLIDKEFDAAIRLIENHAFAKIICNNSGIAFEAYKRKIPWIAGPYLNISNSYSLNALKEEFNACGAFISNELNKVQLKNIRKPENFQLYCSIFRPNLLMISRACLFQTTSPCGKKEMQDDCLSNCERKASISNLNEQEFCIQKNKGSYNALYDSLHYMNPEIVSDFPRLFSGFMVDLSPVHTQSCFQTKPIEHLNLFNDLIKGKQNSASELYKNIRPTTNQQYD